MKWIILSAFILFGGSYFFYKHSGFFLYEHNPIRWMPDMHQTKMLKPQRDFSFYTNGAGARVPPEGSLARSQILYPWGKDKRAENVPQKVNELSISRETVMRGHKMYATYCGVCHGAEGHGNGSVVGPFPAPPSLHSQKIRLYADSQIFHIITQGQNTMPSYAAQIREQDRWTIIHYVRVLQKAENPTENDLRAFQKFIKSGG